MNVDALQIRPWPDPVIDTVGHDPRSHYVEEFWLGILGPSTTGISTEPGPEFHGYTTFRESVSKRCSQP